MRERDYEGKKCHSCKIVKKIACFSVDRSQKYHVSANCKRCLKERRVKYNKKYPWVSIFNAAKQRCVSGKYKKYGRKFLMTVWDFKYLWFRDRAFAMKKPSIDRIKNEGNYELNNCRFIELAENVRRNVVGRKNNANQLKASVSTIKVVNKKRGAYTGRIANYKNGGLINIFSSATQAARFYNIPQQNISACCLGKNKTTGGFEWKRWKVEQV